MQHSNTGSPNNLPAALESLSRVSARPLSHPLAVPPFDLGLRLISEIDIRDRREALPGVLPGDTAVASCAVQMVDPKICLLIFVSGKVVLTGAPRVAAFPLHANSHSCTPLSRCSLRTHAHCAHRVHCCGGGELPADLERLLPSGAGAKNRGEIQKAFRKIYPVLVQFKKVRDQRDDSERWSSQGWASLQCRAVQKR